MKKQDIQTIVVGVDLSKYSKVVVDQAKILSRKMNAPIIYVYVYQDLAIYQDTFSLVMPQISANYQKDVRRKYSLNASDEVLVRFGRPDEEIIRVAKKCQSPMIFIGHRGQNPFVRLLIGSTAEGLASLSPFPVWIHRGTGALLPKNILVPTDLSEGIQHTIEEVARLNRAVKAHLELFHVMELPMPVLDAGMWANVYGQMKKIDDLKVKAFKKKHPKLKVDKSFGSVASSIQDRAKKHDLIALSPRTGRKAAPMFGSVTSKLIRTGQTPILVIP